MVSVLWKREWLPKEYRQENRRNTPRSASSGNASGSRKNTGKKTEEIPHGIHTWSASSGNASGSRKNTGKKTEEIPHEPHEIDSGPFIWHFYVLESMPAVKYDVAPMVIMQQS
ncbi:hypothetical protein NDU88_003971 [Pleurodeles waltl]|uniref:Uncharacterized protein n=1 Tax=Pleurodeles waltl TaxID=8319 RepID=A0AAV7REF4_PLEWA|nr:hypothetical protein NDU88_003971 [Pleurodeles waltl]